MGKKRAEAGKKKKQEKQPEDKPVGDGDPGKDGKDQFQPGEDIRQEPEKMKNKIYEKELRNVTKQVRF